MATQGNEHHLKSGEVGEEGLMAAKMDNYITTVTIIVVQIAVIVGFAFMTYSAPHAGWASSYGYFRDVNVMIFFGFGFLMTFLHRHGLSAIGYCLVISALTAEMSLCAEYLVNKGSEVPKIEDKYPINIENLMNALFCAGAVMISYGAVIGKVTPLQLVVMAILEVFAFWVNIRLVFGEIEAHDVGGGMVIHTFGAYFGLAATWWLNKSAVNDNPEEKSIYSSDLFSLTGTIFLWVLWPSFQSAVAGPEERQFLAVTNTFVSLCSSTLAFAAVTRWLNKSKFDVVHMQNATLAGGVAMGVAGDMNMGMHGAMLAGFGAGTLSCIGYTLVLPILAKFSIHDTCGVHNLHGMPGILGAVVGIIVTAQLGDGKDNGTRGIRGFTKADGSGVGAGDQALALFVSLAMGLGCGFLTGFLMTWPLRMLGVVVPDAELFNDRLFFGESDDYVDIVTGISQPALMQGDASSQPVAQATPVAPQKVAEPAAAETNAVVVPVESSVQQVKIKDTMYEESDI